MMTTEAAYVHVVAVIREQIRSGQLKPNDRIPSISQLRARFGVSYGTLRSAILVLKAEKLLIGRQGRGVYVAAPPQDSSPVT